MYIKRNRYWLLFMLLLLLAHIPMPALAQGSCELPDPGPIFADATYNLSADCTLTGTLTVSSGVTITINGNGHTISANGASFPIITDGPNSVTNLNNLTIDGGGLIRPVMINSRRLTMNNVTVRGNGDGVALNVSDDGSATLTNVLFENNRSRAYAPGNATGLNIKTGATVTMRNAVFRNHRFNGGAIVINGSGTLSASGCLAFSGNLPYNAVLRDSSMGSWTGRSLPACSGTIGNGDAAVIAAPVVQPCGLPGPGNLDADATYTLSADCDLGLLGQNQELWVVSEGVTITIQGNGHRLVGGSGGNWSTIYTAGSSVLNLNNVIVEHVKYIAFGTVNADQSAFRNTPDRIFYLLGQARITRSIFENISVSRPAVNASVLLALSFYGMGQAAFSDTDFRNISGDLAPALNTYGAGTMITLEGCINFDNVIPTHYTGNVTDNSSPCRPAQPVGPSPPVTPTKRVSSPATAPTERVKPDDCFQKLGDIGVICRWPDSPAPSIEVWGISPQSGSYFILELQQAQVDGINSQGLIASSGDGRVGVRLLGPECVQRNEAGDDPRVRNVQCIARQLTRADGFLIGSERYILVSMGPNWEGKVHSVILDNSLAGRVIDTVDTFTGLPGRGAPSAASGHITVTESKPNNSQSYVPFVQPQAARADGSIVHIVRPGDTLYTIAVAYRVSPAAIVERNQMSNFGRIILPGRELVIRDAN